jgi:hypothetical protein
MTFKGNGVKVIVGGLSFIIASIAALFIVEFDTDYAYSVAIWDYWTVRNYFFISVSTFIFLNIFGLADNLITKTKSTAESNLKGLYGYILGTLIYFAIGWFVYDFRPRIFCLTIPIFLTTIGFTLKSNKTDKPMFTKKILLISNMILISFLFVMMLNFYFEYESKQEAFEYAQSQFKEIDDRYLDHLDSLDNVFQNKTFPILKKLNNDTLESVVVEQLKLHSAFSKYRRTNEFIEATQLNYLEIYSEMRIMFIIGFIVMTLLNGLYIVFLIRDTRSK